MISGSSFSPAKSFVNFAREFIEALAQSDYGRALRGLDSSEKAWSKRELVAELKAACGGESVCSAVGLTQSASPELEETTSGYVLRHRLPIAEKWSPAKAVFVFTQKPGTEYYRVELRGFEL
jgi:hypothetical protein